MWYRNLKQCAQKEYENYKYSFYDCFPQVCLVFNPISAICQIYPRDGEQAGPGPRAAAHRRPPPVFKAPVSVSGPSGGPSESPARLGARCSFSLVSIIIITQCQYLQFCVNVTETVTLYSRACNEISRKLERAFTRAFTLKNQLRNLVEWVFKHS